MAQVAKSRWMRVVLGLALVVGAVLVAGRFPFENGNYGVWSVVPPVVTLVLAFTLRDVIVALFVGIALGGVITGNIDIVQAFLIPSVGSPTYGLILLVYLWSLGGLIGLWTRTGGAMRFADWASDKMVRGPGSAKFFAWMMGMIFHQGGTISTVLTGATVRPVTDRYRISHEELSYVVDSTASPAATVIPFNVWPIYVGGLAAGTVPLIATEQDGVNFFIRSIPFNFYGIFAVIFTLLFSWDRLPFVGRRMRAAIDRARTTGELDRPGSTPLAAEELTELCVPDNYEPSLIDFFGPILTLIGVAVLPYVWTFFVLGNRASPSLPIAEAFVLAVLVAMVIALARGMSLTDVMAGFISGCKGVTIGALVLALAVTLKTVADELGTASYVVDTFAGSLTPVILPAALLVISMFVAFSTGTSWGTYAVLFPVALPLAWAVHPDPTFLALCFGAVTGGSVFGDQCSPISDTTILSSLSTGCDLMDHVTTQLPLALGAAGLAAIAYTVLAAIIV